MSQIQKSLVDMILCDDGLLAMFLRMVWEGRVEEIPSSE